MSDKGIQNPPAKAGQIWRDNDPRANGRQVRIERVSAGFIRVIGVESGVKTRISKSRFARSSAKRGYTLVTDAPVAEESAPKVEVPVAEAATNVTQPAPDATPSI